MSFSIGAMARGLADGQDATYADRDRRQVRGMQQERHDASMAREDRDASWAKQVRERQAGQWKEQDQEAKMQEQLREAMLQAEVSGDITGVVKTYNDFTGGAIAGYEPTEGGGYRFKSNNGQSFELGREEVMGMAASLFQPGALTQLRRSSAEAQAAAEAEREKLMLNRGEWRTGADGQRSYRLPGDEFTPSPEDSGGRGEPAEVTTNRYVASILGVSEAEAYEIRQAARGKSPQEATLEVAKLIMDNPRSAREAGGIEGAMRMAEEIVDRTMAQPSFTARRGRGGSGGNQGGATEPPPSNDIESILSDADQEVANGWDPRRIAKLMLEDGVEQSVVDEWLARQPES